MNKRNLLRYKNRLLSTRQELSAGKSLVDSLPSTSELQDSCDLATYETDLTTQMRLRQSDGKLMRAIEDALMRIRRSEFSICQACGQSISRARLEAVPWTSISFQ